MKNKKPPIAGRQTVGEKRQLTRMGLQIHIA